MTIGPGVSQSQNQQEGTWSFGDVITDNLQLIFSSDYQREGREVGYIEKAGEYGVKPWTVIPKKLWYFCTDARTIVVATTTLALFGNTFAWYHEETLEFVKGAWEVIKNLPWAQILPKLKFAGWLASSELIIAIGTRTYGRVNDPAITRREINTGANPIHTTPPESIQETSSSSDGDD